LSHINVDYDHPYRLKVLESNYFKLWFSKRIYTFKVIHDFEDLFYNLGLDADENL